MHPSIFREYDIRGLAGKDMDEDDVVLLGKAAGTYLLNHGQSYVVVGRDCRLTSDAYAESIIKGLIATGCDVVDIGVCPTPVFYFTIHHLEAGGGVMVTASHNPPEYNGFKLCIGPDSIYGEEILKIRDIITDGAFREGSGSRAEAKAIDPYLAFVAENISLSRPLRVGIDAGNGTGGVVALPLLKQLGCEVHDLYCDMDGNFPNHEADPTVLDNMQDLIALVKEKKLDVGIGYDGDGDRIGVVDENGSIIYGDKLIILFAREILSRKPGSVFVSEVKCSKTMYDDIEKHGGKAIMWKTGHSLIKAKMKAENAALAGEMSGHIFFEDRYFGFDDAIYASCRLLELLADAGTPLSELLSDIPETYTTPEIRVECPDDKKFGLVKRVTDYFRDTHNVVDIDGVRVLFDDGWGLVRASNTQPALVLRFEALSEERLDEIRALIEGAVEKFKE
ncbi:MAG: phosphomannomutase/phosphoglucomutase [Thermodesulfobacteriota bacterium]|nr:phosphomannomutase/phosphoglucomutase [Thermodesulfobacteriota bacterium]